MGVLYQEIKGFQLKIDTKKLSENKTNRPTKEFYLENKITKPIFLLGTNSKSMYVKLHY